MISTLVSVTLSTTKNIYVPENYTEEDLKKAVELQVVLPQDIFDDWTVDDFTVMNDVE